MRIYKYIYAFIATIAIALGLTACSPSDYELGGNNLTADDLAEGVAYTVTHDADNPNIVYLESKMGSSYLPQWETPQGRYQDQKVTLKIAFPGEYEVKFGVETPAGVVYGNPSRITIDKMCTDFITSEVWTMLTGGVGKSKTWIFDDGTYGYAAGELSYGDPAANPNFGFNNFTSNWDPGKGHCDDENTVNGSYWKSYMTFSLDGGANYSYYNGTTNTTENGVFGLNESSYILSLTDADLMHPDNWSTRLANWRQNLQIVELDENHLRVGYTRVVGDWGGEWLEVFNYVSKEYADNYVPPVDNNPKPALASTWKDDISSLNKSPNTYREIKWVLTDGGDAAAYYDLYGKYVNGSQAASDNGSEMSLILNSVDKSYSMKDADGNEISGEYSLSDDGFISFSNGLLTTSAGKNGAVIKTNPNKSLRVLNYTMDSSDPTEITDLVLGYDINDVNGKRYRYQGFHFVPKVIGGVEQEYFKAGLHFFNSGFTFTDSPTIKVTGDGKYTFKLTGADADPYGMYLDVVKVLAKYPNFDMTITGMRVDGKSIAFDDEQIDRGVGDEKDAQGNGITARRYILNPWNANNYFIVNGFSVLGFNSSLEVDVDIKFDSGKPFITPEEKTTAARKRHAIRRK